MTLTDTIRCPRGLQISKNKKTGSSVNFDFTECRPTKLCREYCYGRLRSQGEGFGTNNGPITWPAQQMMYRRNSLWIKRAKLPELRAEAQRIADLGLFTPEENGLRWNGQGELSEGACRLIPMLAECGVLIWGFSRRVDRLVRLGMRVQRLRRERRIQLGCNPYFIGSIDSSTSEEDLLGLIKATASLNVTGAPAIGMVAFDPLEARLLIDRVKRAAVLCRRGDPDLVMFGYHSNRTITKLGVREECPSTAGEDILCADCRRCSGQVKPA